MELEDRWPLGTHPDVRDELLAAYDHEGRGYHDRLHLTEVLDHLDLLGCDEPAVRLAAWFHDAVYDGRAGAEERSAQWARRALPDPPAGEVARLVRLTEQHRPAADDEPGRLLCDADLAILAADTERYDAYTRGVRQEYAHPRTPRSPTAAPPSCVTSSTAPTCSTPPAPVSSGRNAPTPTSPPS